VVYLITMAELFILSHKLFYKNLYSLILFQFYYRARPLKDLARQ